MLSRFHKIFQLIGLDKAIVYKAIGMGISSLAGIISLVLISINFSSSEQGIYYTFTSIVALQIFFELGLNYVLVQFVAHEFSHLNLTERGDIVGDESHLSRLNSIFRLFLKWFFVSAILLAIVLLIAGFIFFKIYNKDSSILWQSPWFLLCISTALFYLINMFLSCIEGFGHVKKVEEIRMLAQMIALPLMLGCLASKKYGLYALSVHSFARCVAYCFFLLKYNYAKILMSLWKKTTTNQVSYLKEIFPFQWKIALSWMSGYLIFHLFNPVLFAFEGAKVAGQMGMTIAVLNLISNFSFCWINTKVPRFAMLISQDNFKELDKLFYRSLKQVSVILLFALCIFILLLKSLQYFKIHFHGVLLIDRFLPTIPLLLMIISGIANLYVGAWATYLRSHKQEPYLWLSIITGITTVLSIFFLTQHFGVVGMSAGFCLISLAGSIVGYKIFIKNKKRWHSQTA